MSCGVCFDGEDELQFKGDYLRDLPCAHKFCLHCIDEWIIQQSGQIQGEATCPMCRSPFDRNVVDELSRPIQWIDYLIIPIMLLIMMIQVQKFDS
jgi:hypothetical protein